MIISFSIEVSRGARSDKHLEKLRKQRGSVLDRASDNEAFINELSDRWPSAPMGLGLVGSSIGSQHPVETPDQLEMPLKQEAEPVEPVRTKIPVQIEEDEELEQTARRREAGLKAAATRKVNLLKKAEALKREQRRAKRAATIAAKKQIG